MLWALQYAHRGRHICIYANMFYLSEKVKEDKRNSPRMPKMTCHLLRPVLSWISWSPSPISAFRPPAVQKKSMKTRSGSPQIKDIHITISSIYQRTTSTNDQAELSVNRMSTSSTKSDQNPRTENNSTSTTATSIIITTNQVQFSPSQRRPSPPAAPSLPSSSSWLPWSPKDLEIRKLLNMYDVRVLLKNEKDKLPRFQIVLRVGECFQNILYFGTLPLDWGWVDPVPGTFF